MIISVRRSVLEQAIELEKQYGTNALAESDGEVHAYLLACESADPEEEIKLHILEDN